MSYLENPIRWDHTGQENSFTLSGLRDVRGVSRGNGVLYFWVQPEARGRRQIEFYQSQSVAIEFKGDESGQLSFGLDDKMIPPPSGVVSLSDQGFIIAPCLKVKTVKQEIVLMLLSPPTSPPELTAEKSILSVKDGEETVALSTDGNEVNCRGTISGPFKTAHIVLNRNPNLRVYKNGFNQEISEAKLPGEINVTWKPVSREFEEHLIAFDGSNPQIRIVDDLLEWMRWSKDPLDNDPGDFVIGDGLGVNYTIRLVLDRGLGRHVSDETRVTITRP
jgi:hypothetical protein